MADGAADGVPVPVSGEPASRDQTGPARAWAVAGPTGTGTPGTGAWTTTTTLSVPRSTVQETMRTRWAAATAAARAQPPSASSSRRSAAASAARSAAEAARCLAHSTDSSARTAPNTAKPSRASPTSQIVADPRSRAAEVVRADGRES
ncbi:hypothetical protein GCM10009665_56780 [Kitasatospora nipponensis]|uniref:Uncharacterized protein n=1 Tax=Kitasatospora nipponensis TaxID=258049 RepID=A0ABP4HCE1_9ACTN